MKFGKEKVDWRNMEYRRERRSMSWRNGRPLRSTNQLTEEHSDDNFCEGSVVESIG